MKKVWKNGHYAGYVDVLHNAMKVVLTYKKENIGMITTGGIHDGEYLRVYSAKLKFEHRRKGFGIKMYKILMRHMSPQFVGLATYIPDNVSKRAWKKLKAKRNGKFLRVKK